MDCNTPIVTLDNKNKAAATLSINADSTLLHYMEVWQWRGQVLTLGGASTEKGAKIRAK